MEPLNRSYGATQTARPLAPTGLRVSCKAWASAQQNGSGYSDLRTAPVSSFLFLRCAATRTANLCSASSRRRKTALRPKQRRSCPAALWRSTITGVGESWRMVQQVKQESEVETIRALAALV